MRTCIVSFLSLSVMACFFACRKHVDSQPPTISFKKVYNGLNLQGDSALLVQFEVTDLDADIGNHAPSSIYYKDSRDTTGTYVSAEFPTIDSTIEDPHKGIKLLVDLEPFPPPERRHDAAHQLSDTLTYELYVVDRAGNPSNHVRTDAIVINK